MSQLTNFEFGSAAPEKQKDPIRIFGSDGTRITNAAAMFADKHGQ